MKLRTLKLHTRILLALVLGALFGVLFRTAGNELTVMTRSGGEPASASVGPWEWIELRSADTDSLLARFGPNDQLRVMAYWNVLSSERRHRLVMVVRSADAGDARGGEVRRLEGITAIDRPKTIAVLIKPLGQLFIRLLMFVAIPLVVSSLIVGASSLGDLRRVGRIGARAIVFYCITIVSAITLGLLAVNTIRPGARLAEEAKERLMVAYAGGVEEKIQQQGGFDLIDTVLRIVATNPVDALARGDMLQIVFLSIMVGVCLTMITKEKAAPVISFFDGFSDLMIRMVDLIMLIAPIGVFALIAATVAELGFEILSTLAWYAGTLIAALLVHQFVTLGLLVKVLGGMNPLTFFKGIRQVMVIAFSSSSSAATLPVTMESCEQNLGVPKQITSFVLPLGATVNMDGTSMYQAVATVFIAQVYGIELTLAQQLTVLFMAVLASIGTAPVPGVGIIMLLIVLRSVNVPEEGIALILGIDRFLDMCRTVPNVTGDAVVSVIVARQEGVLRPVQEGSAA